MAAISKAEYLKRYMSDEPTEKKKKRRKVNKTAAHLVRSRIVDDDVDFKSLLPSNLENTLEEDVGDNEPTIADVIDERPDYIKRLEAYRDEGKWKLMGKDGKPEDRNSQSPLKKARHDSDSDQSPKRKGRHDSDSDQSPKRKGRHDSDSDQSPKRKGRHDSDSDESPKRKGRHDSDSDESPPRRRKNKINSDQSPPSNKRHDSDSDQSPPRKTKSGSYKTKDRHDSDMSPSRNKKHVLNSSKSSLNNRHSDKQRHSPESDHSAPRRRKQGSDSDQSPPRKSSHSSDYNRSKINSFRDRHGEDYSERSSSRTSRFSDKSEASNRSEKSSKIYSNQPIRKRGHSSDSDQSPPRKRSQDSDKSADQKMKKTLSGKKAGLSSARDMKEEARKLKKKEEEAFKQIGDENLGKNAATVFRDKSGKRRNLKEEREKTEEELAKEAAKDAKYKEWGKGLKQREVQEQTLADHLHEMSKPLARYKDDDDLDKMMRDQDREGDPMLAFMIKKSKVKDGSKVKEKPKYKGPAPPPNRFGIMPGYRWDGVDRSNGFEKALFSKMSDRKATEIQAYKWSTEDM